MMSDFSSLAFGIFALGYESWREAVEIKSLLADGSDLGKPMDVGSVLPAKGFTRLSCIFFGLLYTFYELKKDWNQEEEEDFKKRLSCSLC